MIEGQLTKVLTVIQPVAILDNSSWTTVEVDTQGWDYAEFYFMLGATDIGITVLKIRHATTTGGTFADISGCVYGTSTTTDGATSVLPSATGDDLIYGFEIDLRDKRRFLDLIATIDNGAAGGFASALCILSRGNAGPVTGAERGCNQIVRST